ncbi:MAG: DUF448 domain-containing protein [Fusobacteriaceae bacterium]|nr:DUF448 domain-containing protein [Fusobacteriaceae bacterium]
MNNDNFPERTCLICKKKSFKEDLFRMCQKDSVNYFFDKNQIFQARGYYICKDHNCLKKLASHNKIKISPDDLIKMLNCLKKVEKNYLNILKPMKYSKYLSFGVNMVLEDIEKIYFIIIAQDIASNPEKRILEKINEYGIKHIYYSTKSQLGDIFGKEEVNVVGIKNKRIARGFID